MKLVTSMTGRPVMLSSLPRHRVIDLILPKHVGAGRASHPGHAFSAIAGGALASRGALLMVRAAERFGRAQEN
jgi:hypothetical protein